MPGWLQRALAAVAARTAAAAPDAERGEAAAAAPGPTPEAPLRVRASPGGRRRVLVVDDDPPLRLLLRTTLDADEFAIEEAASAEEAAELARFWQPDAVLLDVGLPGEDGLAFARQLRERTCFGSPRVILVTGAETSEDEARAAGAHALLRKPFSPLELIALLDDLDAPRVPAPPAGAGGEAEQLLVYARDLARLLRAERSQRRLLQLAYRQTVTALGDALDARTPATGFHARRVQRYALELTAAVEPTLLDDPSVEYGYLLHDVGKIAIPDRILEKPGPLDAHERDVMRRHPLVGAQILGEITLLQGQGIGVVRSHHERWDGDGYPDGLVARQIPSAARIFAVADALDAITSDRPYRPRRSWDEAVDEIVACAGSQFDPTVVAALTRRHVRLHRIHDELDTAAV